MTVLVEITKNIAGTVTAIGAQQIIKHAVAKVVPATLSKADKVLIGIGTFGIASVVGGAVASHVEETIDKVVTIFEDTVDHIKEMKKVQKGE